MDNKPPHNRTSTTLTPSTSDLFICFTSRLSHSSSMRLSSSAAPTTLTPSLSRRLLHNGSLRGGTHSPALFPSSKKTKTSSSFIDNPEPSSPKVTCIGQVRVHTQKHRHKFKLRASKRKFTRPGCETGFGNEDSIFSYNSNSNDQECRNQRWPLTICEALRTFGNEISCLLPCKSSCFSNGSEREKGEERESNGSSCGAVFRWLMSMQEGEDGKRRDIELVVGDDAEERERGRGCSRRRSIFDDMEFDDLFKDVCNNNVDMNGNGEGEEKGRVSICEPPKNALLLMRCRSDPVKLASLSKKIWEPNVVLDGGDDDGGDDEDVENVKVEVNEGRRVEFDEKLEVKEVEIEDIGEESVKLGEGINDLGEDLVGVKGMNDDLQACDEEQLVEGEEVVEQEVEEMQKNVAEVEENQGIANKDETEEDQEHVKDVIFEETHMIEDENLGIGSSIESISVQEKCQDFEVELDLVNNDSCNLECVESEHDLDIDSCNEEEFEDAQNEQDLVNKWCNEEMQMQEEERVRAKSSALSSSSSVASLSSSDKSTVESNVIEEVYQEEEYTVEEVKVARMENTPEHESKFEDIEQEYQSKFEDKEQENESKFEDREQEYQSISEEKEQEKTISKPTLPDCLLLMMCEPKLSMEVSKETWVCKTDFVRWLPDHHKNKKTTKTDVSDDKKTVAAVAPPAAVLPSHPLAPQPYQPGRSSISFPAGGVANLIGQKLAKAGVGCEPFALTRCKSAPHRSTAKLLGPELACSLWGRENGRKLEPHRQATCGVGAGGIGF